MYDVSIKMDEIKQYAVLLKENGLLSNPLVFDVLRSEFILF